MNSTTKRILIIGIIVIAVVLTVLAARSGAGGDGAGSPPATAAAAGQADRPAAAAVEYDHANGRMIEWSDSSKTSKYAEGSVARDADGKIILPARKTDNWLYYHPDPANDLVRFSVTYPTTPGGEIVWTEYNNDTPVEDPALKLPWQASAPRAGSVRDSSADGGRPFTP